MGCPSMLPEGPISVSILSSIQLLLVLRKQLVIGQFRSSLCFIGHDLGINLPESAGTSLITGRETVRAVHSCNRCYCVN